MADVIRTRVQYLPKSPAVAVKIAERGLKGDTGATGPQGPQGPQGPTGSSVPATTTSLGGVIVGGGLSVITAGNATTNGTLSTNATLIGLGNVDNTPDLAKPISNLTQTALDGKASLTHNHTIANITGLQAALDGKQATGNYVLGNDTRLSDARTPLAHTHAISEVTGLQTALDGKLSITSANATFQPISGMSVYLTANLAATTYQTIANNTFANLSGAPNISLYAPLANASLTGTPTAPTAANGTNTTQLATTAFVANATAGLLSNSAAVGLQLTGSSGSNAQAARIDHVHADRACGTAGTYGGAATVPVFTTDTTGRVSSVTPTAIQIDAANVTSGTLANARLGVAGMTLTWASPATSWACNFLQTATLTLTGASTTLSASGHVAGGTYVLILKQDATGNRAVIWSGFKWPSGTAPVISTAANSIDILTFISDGTSLYGVAQKAFA